MAGDSKNGAQKKAWAPKKAYERKPFYQTMTILGVLQFPRTFSFLLGSFVGTLIYLIAPEMVLWLKKESEDQSGGPRTNLEVFGDEVSFQYFQKP